MFSSSFRGLFRTRFEAIQGETVLSSSLKALREARGCDGSSMGEVRLRPLLSRVEIFRIHILIIVLKRSSQSRMCDTLLECHGGGRVSI